jgi:excisionase family DNA binding protein
MRTDVGPRPATASLLPSDAEAALAKETSRALASRLRGDRLIRLRIVGDGSSETVKLPATAARLLVRILDEMGRGNAVTVVPVRAELTTQEAADLLNISRPSLIQLLQDGKIDYRLVGTHRRVRFDALIEYKRQADAARRAALAELAAYDQELGI